MSWVFHPRNAFLTVLLGLIVAGGVFARPASAAPGASDWVRTDFADVRLVSAVSGTEGQDSVPLGLQFRLAEGWKVYWRAPGDAGYPPEIDWSGSDNLAGTSWRWPGPERVSLLQRYLCAADCQSGA